jgi:hypothetical protein
MTDSIQLYAPSSNTPFLTLTSAALTLSVDEDDNVWYQGASGPAQVETVKAILSSSQLTLTLTPQRGADLSQFTYVEGEPVTQNALVSSGVSWSQSSGDLVVACLTPATSNDEYKWTFTNQVPPVALKVNIRRQ